MSPAFLEKSFVFFTALNTSPHRFFWILALIEQTHSVNTKPHRCNFVNTSPQRIVWARTLHAIKRDSIVSKKKKKHSIVSSEYAWSLPQVQHVTYTHTHCVSTNPSCYQKRLHCVKKKKNIPLCLLSMRGVYHKFNTPPTHTHTHKHTHTHTHTHTRAPVFCQKSLCWQNTGACACACVCVWVSEWVSECVCVCVCVTCVTCGRIHSYSMDRMGFFCFDLCHIQRALYLSNEPYSISKEPCTLSKTSPAFCQKSPACYGQKPRLCFVWWADFDRM